ncbi:hypothetical protein PgNI_06116 [Pyricularia grisea]|uniref:Uncharacterized protein n=1 Tax=Pyricularia grisea TaxID=148305 RepID=A0A6P8B5K4_PYRGI|nr:hypothetical protein PgNI_06116 [Pyricularia grisea]TLD10621.1 hypothetical protein PgNI_06116 [Pyricularia grisea]
MNQVLGPIKLSAGPVAASATRIGARFEAGMIGLGLAGGSLPSSKSAAELNISLPLATSPPITDIV